MRQADKIEFNNVFSLLHEVKNNHVVGVAKELLSDAISKLEVLQGRLDLDHMNYCNIETAFADIFITNNQWASDHVRTMIAEIKAAPNDSEGVWTDEQFVRFTLADHLKEWFEELQEGMVDRSWQTESSFSTYRDRSQRWKDTALGLRDIGSLHRVEWSEVVESQMSE